MSFPTLRGYAVYWAPLNNGKTDEQGKIEISNEPREIRVHWENNQKEFRDPMGELLVSSALVMCNEKLLYRGILKRGRLASLESTDYQSNTDTFSILGESVVESVGGNKVTMEYYL